MNNRDMQAQKNHGGSMTMTIALFNKVFFAQAKTSMVARTVPLLP